MLVQDWNILIVEDEFESVQVATRPAKAESLLTRLAMPEMAGKH